ncbi:hypothetical protein HQ545_03070 [Candidatus Woesearchaeota archaeon]|nr:hypothetical protein [Candidatus Woesearchaeota archaeon]
MENIAKEQFDKVETIESEWLIHPTKTSFLLTAEVDAIQNEALCNIEKQIELAERLYVYLKFCAVKELAKDNYKRLMSPGYWSYWAEQYNKMVDMILSERNRLESFKLQKINEETFKH